MKFSEIPGHKNIKDNLRKSIQNHRLHHALMLIDTASGTGLAHALAIARYLLCENRNEDEACQECNSCRKNAILQHPDVFFTYPVIKRGTEAPVSADFIEEWRKALLENPFLSYSRWMKIIDAENKQGNITARECREIIRHLSLKSYFGSKKIQIIWLAEYLGEQGNILLKILEEPPTDTHFILVVENPDRVLNTIKSRSQMILLPPLSHDEIKNYLVTHLQEEENKADRIASLSEGNIISALEKVFHPEWTFHDLLSEWMSYCRTQRVNDLYFWVEKFSKEGREIQKNFLNYFLSVIRRKLHQNIISPAKDKNNSQEVLPLTAILPEKISLKQLDKIQEMVSKAHYYISRNAHQKIVFFDLSLQISKVLNSGK